MQLQNEIQSSTLLSVDIDKNGTTDESKWTTVTEVNVTSEYLVKVGLWQYPQYAETQVGLDNHILIKTNYQTGEWESAQSISYNIGFFHKP
ncbi:MAG: hypothetical protein NC236_00470 [Mycoplasma sp.]|nr:hypothetical protein [Mycoplasma sp.]